MYPPGSAMIAVVGGELGTPAVHLAALLQLPLPAIQDDVWPAALPQEIARPAAARSLLVLHLTPHFASIASRHGD
jgi:hypothetical protein